MVEIDAASELKRRTPHELRADSPTAMPTMRDTVTSAEPVAIHLGPPAEVTLAPMGPMTRPKPRPLISEVDQTESRSAGSIGQRLTRR